MESWTTAIDAYCERLGPGFWAEPLNAVSNLAFIVGAAVAWIYANRQTNPPDRQRDWAVIALCLVLTAIGIGSFLFHTLANRWSATADVLPILLYILLYLYLTVRRYLAMPFLAAALAGLAFFPWSYLVQQWLTPALGRLNGSIGYVPTLLLLVIFATILALRAHAAWKGVAVAAGLLVVSLTARTLDNQSGDFCAAVPMGTHWAWHLLNGTLLGLLAVTFVRHGARRPEPEPASPSS